MFGWLREWRRRWREQIVKSTITVAIDTMRKEWLAVEKQRSEWGFETPLVERIESFSRAYFYSIPEQWPRLRSASPRMIWLIILGATSSSGTATREEMEEAWGLLEVHYNSFSLPPPEIETDPLLEVAWKKKTKGAT